MQQRNALAGEEISVWLNFSDPIIVRNTASEENDYDDEYDEDIDPWITARRKLLEEREGLIDEC